MSGLQFEGLVRQVMSIFGTYLVASGYLDNGMAEQLVGAVAVVASVAWTVFRNRKIGVVSAAAALPEVTDIKVTTNALADNVPSDKVKSLRG